LAHLAQNVGIPLIPSFFYNFQTGCNFQGRITPKKIFFEMFKVEMFLLFQPSHLGIVWKMELGRRWQTMINVWM
jgi:hypothetical protein